ncbi:deoxyhypusine hydroxylase-A-like [Olea europaea var. sylvestris]|uniref:deoxyhypusine hydroxylase-A-like n=1 Tax=Olea europaea var. sylvestris TaxID=158386 RepID=UPI000C1D5643|nr:deoxyhypusine hydroxylase-A-like [Olea europaea var. sylvestris]
MGGWVFVEFLCDLLLDENQPITERFRAFSLRLIGSHPSAINSFIKAMRDDSTLLAYEAAYRLGRTRKSDAIHALKAVVEDFSLHPIVSVKAVESLGAFGLETSILVLQTSFQSDPSPEVRDTCEVALTQIRELKKCHSQ